jgi:hypothetical protein
VFHIQTNGKPLAVTAVYADGKSLVIRCHDALNAAQWYELIVPLEALVFAVETCRVAGVVGSTADVPLKHENVLPSLDVFTQLPEVPPR